MSTFNIQSNYTAIVENERKNNSGVIAHNFDTGKRLHKAFTLSDKKETYKKLVSMLQEVNKVESSTLDKKRKFYAKMVNIPNVKEVLTTLDEKSSYTVIESLTALNFEALKILLSLHIDTVNDITFTAKKAEILVSLVQSEGMTIDKAIETLPKYAEHVKEVEALTVEDDETTEIEEKTEVAIPVVTLEQVLFAFLGENCNVSSLSTLDEIVNAITLAIDKDIPVENEVIA